MSEFLPKEYVPYIDPTEAVFIMDPKEAARLAYRPNPDTADHAQIVAEKKSHKELRQAVSFNRSLKQKLMPSDDQLIGESLDSIVEPDTSDWSHVEWLDDDTDTAGPAPIYYDGPYNPEKEARRRAEAKIAADQAIMAKAESLLDDLNARNLKPGDALQGLLTSTWGDERERLLDMINSYLGVNPYEGIDSQAEFGLIMGAGNLATRRTVDISPYEDYDYLDGFQIIKPL
jgi:hypothetical protein